MRAWKPNRSEEPLRRRTRRRGPTFALVLLLGLMAPLATTASDGHRGKDYWQERYAGLLKEADRLRATIERETELYADANRRNYRRGKKRHVHRVAAAEAREELARVEALLDQLPEDARRQGALPGWLYEVEERHAERRQAGDAPAAQDPAETGRNPLFLESDTRPRAN